jgi:hypothetical protein
MALKRINENPTISDAILLEIETPNAIGCFDTNPYKVDTLTIYYVERSFFGENYGEYDTKTVSERLQKALLKAERDLCDNPTEDNVLKRDQIKAEIASSSQTNTIYFKERSVVKVVGTEGFPAWLSTDVENSPLVLRPESPEGSPQVGRFTYEWNPQGSVREGDYFVCWTWTPLPDGEKLSAHLHFMIQGDGYAVSATPEHVTAEGKYETLLERYLPEMYKFTLSNSDITPQVTEQLNLSVAKGFKFLEDMANQIIDLFDANALHESMLTYLSNIFAVKLKSSDPTLWRRQIKEAIPLFKRKGTLQGLKNAFFQSGMELNAFVQYWQIVPRHTWVESFKVVDSASFSLEKKEIVLPINQVNFQLYLKRVNTNDYVTVSSDNVSFDTGEDGVIIMTWVGDQLSANAIDLYQGDTIKVMYQYRAVGSNADQILENYVRLLPLMDQRDDNDQEFPPKNWNVRLIAEDDPLFATLIPVRHPFADPLQFGWVRTEFAYSENIYNSEEYNGSTRPAFDPCKIDKNFIDPCGACLSSSYSVDIGVEELSNDRMFEAQEILREYMPFHAQVHSINFRGEVNEFVQSPVEHIDTLINIDRVQYILSGNKNPFFSRTMDGGLSNWVVTREDLTDQITVLSGKSGTAYNDHVAFIAPDYNLNSLGVIWDNHILEVLSPSANTGIYSIDQIQGSMARVAASVVEPLDKTAFTFKLSNVTYESTVSSIKQDNQIKLTDVDFDFDIKDIRTQWDVDHDDSPSGAWSVLIPAYSSTPYAILDIQNNALILQSDPSLPSVEVSGVSYSLRDNLANEKKSSTTGKLAIKKRARVNFNDTAILNLSEFIKSGDFLYYDGNEYVILSIQGDEFFIDNYDEGDAESVTVQSRRRLVEQGTGYFGYKGLRLTTFADHEAEFEIINGENSPPVDEYTYNNKFKENFLFKIENEFYKIASIDEKEVVLEGREQDWGTSFSGGSIVDYSIIHFPKKQVNVGFVVFDQLGRDGYDPVIREIYSDIDKNTAIVALSTPKGSGVQENVSQEEGISIEIETKEGEKFEGEI